MESDEIKKAVSTRPVFEPMGHEPLPHEITDLEKMVAETPKHAPLFVKIDKYKEILENMQMLKANLYELQKLLSIREKIEKSKSDSDVIIEKALEKLTDTINKLNREFTIPKRLKPYVKGVKTTKVDGFISELDAEIRKLRDEISKINV